MYTYFNTKGIHYADKDLAITFLKKGKNSFEVNLCPSGEISRIKVVAVSPSTGEKYLQLEYRLSVPGNEIKSYAFTAAEDIELVISRRGKLIKRLKPKEAFSI
jgi:hypothetical protein